MTKKRFLFIILYAVFLAIGTLLSFDDYRIYKTTISSDSTILLGLLHLLLVYGITFWIFTFLIHKITHSSYGITATFVIISAIISLILDPYIYNRDHFPKSFNFFHDEFQVYVFLLYSSVLTLSIFPIYLIGRKANMRKAAIEKATGRNRCA